MLAGSILYPARRRHNAAQAYALIDGLEADVVVADAANRGHEAIPDEGAVAVIPSNPPRALEIPLD